MEKYSDLLQAIYECYACGNNEKETEVFVCIQY